MHLVDYDLQYPPPIIGADEVGRGCWAGPLVAAGVVLDLTATPLDLLSKIQDSKKVSKRKRALLAQQIKEHAVHCNIQWRSAQQIDEYGLQWANKDAVTCALDGPWQQKLADYIGGWQPADTIVLVKGDATSVHIAAASIVAKVARDTYMQQLDDRYPGYGFSQHAGYGTAQHRAAIERLGVCVEHRRSFRLPTQQT